MAHGRSLGSLIVLSIAALACQALRFDPAFIDYNLNQNQTATNVLDYYGKWDSHTFFPSPTNWRVPFYTVFVDRFVNGNPVNDNANGTMFEQDLMQTQLRHGGDLEGIIDSLDYIQGMGIKALYLAGSPMLNIPWEADQYAPLDLSLLDAHLGNITTWRRFVTAVHDRDMYVILDNTMATMGDLVAFDGYLNTSAPFTLQEHNAVWKFYNRRYLDFDISNEYNTSCEYPRFWLETGFPVGEDVRSQMKGCYESEFDQYGDTEAFGVFPDWQRQLSKFASVQDRLREWKPSVRDKIKVFSCNMIRMLDIDGFRIDKATQVTVDALADFSNAMRDCARSVGKENFFIPGEITGGNIFGSIYLGRGKQPDMQYSSLLESVSGNQSTNASAFIRDPQFQALDSAAFHYSVYRTLTRFLGMDGNLAAGYDTSLDWVEAWNQMLMTNDFINPNTGLVDPRHMYGVTNQDVFRWPAITFGTERMLLGLFMTTLHLPGIPLLLWGEEQAFYLLDNAASNYIYGRQAMSFSPAWQIHGCYKLNSQQYYQMPLESALTGCGDDWNSMDHRDPTSPVRLILKAMYEMRARYPVLNDGWYLQELSKQTRDLLYPGSSGIATETGLWSIFRYLFNPAQNFTGRAFADQPAWLVYHNDNTTIDYHFDCTKNETAIISPFVSGQIVKNLFYPYEEITLAAGPKTLGFNGSALPNGCTGVITLQPYSFKTFVLKDVWTATNPAIVGVSPSYDARLLSQAQPGAQENLQLEILFSAPMSCASVTNSITFSSKTEDNSTPFIDQSSIVCADQPVAQTTSNLTGSPPAVWSFRATIIGVADGLHSYTVRNASNAAGTLYTNSADKFIFRLGQADNPIVFPSSANYTRELLHQDSQGGFYVSHKAAGADQYRYSLNWGSSWSDWQAYLGGNSSLVPQAWSGTDRQAWEGEHLIMQYYNRLTGSSSYQQHADLASSQQLQRRFPHLFAHGPFNQFGFDSGIANALALVEDGKWQFDFVTEWPAVFQLNVWGINPDGQPDQTGVFGDSDGDSILDRVPPTSLASSLLNLSVAPPLPYLGWRVVITDGDLRFDVKPVGNMVKQIIIFALLLLIPPLTGFMAVFFFKRSFYQIKMNREGVDDKGTAVPNFLRKPIAKLSLQQRRLAARAIPSFALSKLSQVKQSTMAMSRELGAKKRKTVLIATMEYDIEDWEIKIKIGGLGVMAQLMGKSLGHQDLVWVVPCVGGVDYPEDERAASMTVTIIGRKYEVEVQYHRLRNITYVLLDAPIFRGQSKKEPYPARMDDLDSAIYYSAWNQCIAQAIKRFPVDVYHINDYHGALAPLHLLPKTIPVALSLHNAEFQGLWPMRTSQEIKEVCEVFNISVAIAKTYVQFGDVFNLLHTGSSYLRLHQKGFGAVGVSKKYGKRSWARYPIFWGLSEIGQLPNPDPSDTLEWSGKQDTSKVVVDLDAEKQRKELRKQAQAWADLEINEDAELFVFVGRWSMQKGIDLIADVMPAVLEQHKNAQLICVGPVIDLYGKFAALKLGVMAQKYPGRVCSKPVFTALPPYIFSGAEWALIPSRDEPFGLVAVEFGRKGALGIGARVGGLGQMPGWWFTIESTTTTHLLRQFKSAIEEALASKLEVRQLMRAQSAKQRFPVAQWVEDLEILQSRAIVMHKRTDKKNLLHRKANRTHSRSESVSSSASSDDEFMPVDPKDPQHLVPDPTSKMPAAHASLGSSQLVSLGTRLGPSTSSSLYSSEKTDYPASDDEYLDKKTLDSEFVEEEEEELITVKEAEAYRNRGATLDESQRTLSDHKQSQSTEENMNSSPSFWRPHRSFHTPSSSMDDGASTLVNSPSASWNEFVGRRTTSLMDDPVPAEGFLGAINVSSDHTSVTDRLDKQLYKLKAQELAGLEPDKNADIFIFSGRWSMANGIDIVADVIPAILESQPQTQFIVIGPIFDTYGKFAELKLEAISQRYPGRLYANPSSFSISAFLLGADFALQPSRGGLFGAADRMYESYGILPIGSRLEGQKSRPGWWYKPKSKAAQDLIQLLKSAMLDALSASQEERDAMRLAGLQKKTTDWTDQINEIHKSALASLEGGQTHKVPPRSVSQQKFEAPSAIKMALGTIEEEFSIPVRESSREVTLSTTDLHDDKVDWDESESLVESESAVDDDDFKRSRTSYEHQSLDAPEQNLGRSIFEKASALVASAPLLPVRMSSLEGEAEKEPGTIGQVVSYLSTAAWARRIGQQMSYALPAASGSPSLTREQTQGADDMHSGFVRASQMTSEDLHVPGRVSSVEVWVEDVHGEPRQRRGSRQQRKAIRIVREDTTEVPGRVSSLEIWIEEDPSEQSGPSRGYSASSALGDTVTAVLSKFQGDSTAEESVGMIGPRSTSFAWTADSGAQDHGGVRIRIKESISTLSLQSIVGEKKDFNLQKVDPFFTDSNQEYYKSFEKSLSQLKGSNSEDLLCIEVYLEKSEKEWFRRYRAAKLGFPASTKPTAMAPQGFSRLAMDSPGVEKGPQSMDYDNYLDSGYDENYSLQDEFLLGADHKPTRGLRRFMSRRLGDWPVYSFFLAIGQIIAANSYQISLLSGTVGQSALQLYVIVTIYLLTSIGWWICHRRFKAVYILSAPFALYGLAFLILGMAPFAPTIFSRGWVQNLASGVYAAAASSGSLYFSLNFGDEGGSPIKSWIFRACMIQGSQQIYVCVLWLWGSFVAEQTTGGLNLQKLLAGSSIAKIGTVLSSASKVLTIITIPIAVALWAVGLTIYYGLPDYYRQKPGTIPAFYGSLFRRHIVIWFFITVMIQNIFMSAPYGRNWQYLWTTNSASLWQIGIMVIIFFIFIWGFLLWMFSRLSKEHSWYIPVFAIGLGAPRWGQMLWSCSTIGQYIPWAGSLTASALVGRGLWLWLNVLDGIQGIGFGMILLQTLTRPHITFTLMTAQVIGSVFTILARAVAPDNVGPGDVFPDFAVSVYPSLGKAWFWIALILQFVICAGFFKFFRKEQLQKP